MGVFKNLWCGLRGVLTEEQLALKSEQERLSKEIERLLLEREQELHPKATEAKAADGTLSITDWNHAYVKDLRSRFPQELTIDKTDAEVVQLFVDRYNHEHVEPKLEVLHSGIDPDGRIKMKLDWNEAFINLLRERGVKGDTDEKMIENYLAMMTRKVDAELFDEDEGDVPPPGALPGEREIERELENMDPEVVRRLEKTLRRRAQLKSPRKRA